jgi:hypothetical protein
LPRRTAFAAFAVLLWGIGGSVAHAEGSLSIGLADPPSNPDDPRAVHYIVERVEPGDRLTRKVQVVNESSDDLDISLYDAAASAPGGRFVWSDGRGENELTRWTSVQPTVLRLEAFTGADPTVTIEVPEDASLGERYGVIWAELPRSDQGVVNRVGLRIYLTVVEPSDSNASVVLVVLALLLVAAVSVLAVAGRRRGTGRAGSTGASR